MATDPQRDAQLSRWLQAVHDAPLDSHSTRYVELDGDLDASRTGLRGTHVDRKLDLYDLIALADASEDPRPTCQLFSGFRGTGKSTELLRLKSLLEAAGYIVLLADACSYHSLARDLTVEELMFIITGALGEQAADERGKPAKTAVPSGWAQCRSVTG